MIIASWFGHKSYRLIVIVFILGAGLGYFVGDTLSLTGDNRGSDSSYQQKRRVFNNVVNYVRDMYVSPEKVTPKQLYYGAIEGLLNSLNDPHSRLMKPDRYDEMKTKINQEFGGLGIYITVRNGELTVIAPIQGTPAFRAGLEPGDVIAGINGNSTEDITKAKQAVEKLRGPKGSKVTLTINRSGHRFDVTVTRGEIPVKSAYSSMLEEWDKIGYLKITNFGKETHDEVDEALERLHDKGMKALLVDVRNNPGGSLKSAKKVADLWIREGRIVYTKGRAPGQDQNFPAHAEGTEPTYPMAILANRGSASGSEILVGALKDRQRAVVMGDTTFGKGLVQSVFPLQDGSALALTTARYYTPEGRMIQDKGITPQIPIKQTLPDTQVRRQLARLNRGDTVLKYVREHTPIDESDIETLINRLRNQGFTLDERYLRSQILRRQMAMKGKTLVASPSTDPQLRRALQQFQRLFEKDQSGLTISFDSPPTWF